MGKNKIIKSLGRGIGNVAVHKIVLKHTNKPESKKHLSDEITDYSADAFEKAQLYSWKEEEKKEIKEKSILRVSNLIKRYSDIEFDEKEAIKFIDETMDEMML